jgi:hypothetical protein
VLLTRTLKCEFGAGLLIIELKESLKVNQALSCRLDL